MCLIKYFKKMFKALLIIVLYKILKKDLFHSLNIFLTFFIRLLFYISRLSPLPLFAPDPQPLPPPTLPLSSINPLSPIPLSFVHDLPLIFLSTNLDPNLCQSTSMNLCRHMPFT